MRFLNKKGERKMKEKLLAMIMLLMLFASVIPLSVEADGIVGNIRGLWHFDEGTGTIAYDSSGHANHGTIYGGAVWTYGKVGNALDFDGANDYVEAPDSNSLDITGKITIEAWIYPHTMTNLQVIVSKYNHSGPPYNGAYYLGLGGYGYMNKILLGLSNDGYHYYYVLSNTNITANTWTHVAATSNGTHMILYINRIKDKVVKYAPGVIYASAAPLRIGCYLPELGYPRFFDGVIDEVKVSATTIWTVDDDRVQCPTADFTGIQAAINAASPDDTIYVYTGTYNENLVVNKALTIQAASDPVIDGGAAGNCISISANNVVISGFEIRNGFNGIAGQTSGSTFSDNIIHDNLNIPGSAGVGILLWGDNDNNIITGNIIYDNDRQGIFIGYSDDTKISTGNVISRNIIYNNGLYRYANGPDASEYGVQLWCADNNIIEHNEIYDHDDWFPYGGTFDFAQGIYLCDSNDNIVVNNYLHDNNYGVGLWHSSRAVVTNHINYNDIVGNTGYGVRTFDLPPLVDARFNWWGDASGPTHASNPGGTGDKISNNVDYSPWLGFVVGTGPMTWHVNPTGVPGAIQEAIDEADSGDTVKVHEGTYTEQLIINKDLTLQGDPKPKLTAPDVRNTYTFPESSATWDPIVFAYGGTESGGAVSGSETVDVTVDGFEIDGGNKAAAAPTRFVGILYRNVNPGVISDNDIHSMYDADGEGDGPQTFGILVYGDSDVKIEHNEVRDFSRGGIGVSGDDGLQPDPVARVKSNTVVGNGLEVGTGWWAENGIQIAWGAGGSAVGNDVADCQVNNPYWVATGILVYDAADGVNILDNSVADCDTGIAVSSPSFDLIDGNVVTGCAWDGIRLGWPVNNCTVSNNIISSNWAGIGVWDASNNIIENNIIENNEYGIYMDGDSHNNVILGNDILNNLIDGIHIEPYGGIDPSGTEIHCNRIVGNSVYGVNKIGTERADATWNWWGSDTGPYHPITNIDGTGDAVSDNVDYRPWKIYCTMKVEPSIVSVGLINKTFSVNITINNLQAEWEAVAFEFRLTYNSTLLEVLDVTEGPFLLQFPQTPTPPYTLFIEFLEDRYYGVHVLVGLILLPNATGGFPGPFPSGNGTIATITFKAIYQEKGYDVARGGYFKPPQTCNLTLVETLIVNPELEYIPHHIEQGYYEILPNNVADLNWDGKVRVDDVFRGALAFGSEPGFPRWDPEADLNGDGRIRVDDIFNIAVNFGWTVDC